jgi:hypothetical protein
MYLVCAFVPAYVGSEDKHGLHINVGQEQGTVNGAT